VYINGIRQFATAVLSEEMIIIRLTASSALSGKIEVKTGSENVFSNENFIVSP